MPYGIHNKVSSKIAVGLSKFCIHFQALAFDLSCSFNENVHQNVKFLFKYLLIVFGKLRSINDSMLRQIAAPGVLR